MNRKQFGQLMAAVTTVFEIKAKNEAGYMVWFNALEDLDYSIATKAVDKLIMTKSGFMSPAEIRQAYTEIINGDKPTLEQTLTDLNRMASKYGRYAINEGYEWLEVANPVAYRIMKAIGYNSYANNDLAYMQPTIKKLHTEIVQSDADSALLQSKFAAEIGSIRSRGLLRCD